MEEIGFPILKPLNILCDNKTAIKISTGEELPFKRSKFVDVKYHIIHDRVRDNQITSGYVHSKENFADQFTKVLPRDSFKYQANNIGLESFHHLDSHSSDNGNE